MTNNESHCSADGFMLTCCNVCCSLLTVGLVGRKYHCTLFGETANMKTVLKIRLSVLLTVLCLTNLVAGDVRHQIAIPDILNYKTLKCDFHIHTVFSDGEVWPTVRVEEAWREGLDAIAITDHIEYQPHKKDIPTNHGRSYEIALPLAKQRNILLVKGAEITRDTPPGHFNAIFLTDIRPLDTNDFNDVFRAANKQGAFVSWNHPFWKPEAKGWLDVHTMLYENKWLHGIEIVNGDTYWPETYRWAIERNLTILGNSDIHDPIVIGQATSKDHRPITLVFATDRSLDALKEALVKGRTAIWFKNKLIGPKQYLDAIFNESVRIVKPHYRQGDTVWFEIRNSSCLDLQLEDTRGSGALVVPANAVIVVSYKAKVADDAESLKLSYRVSNFLIAPKESLVVSVSIVLK